MITNIVFYTTANANSIVQLEIQIKKLNNETCQCVKIVVHAKKDYNWNPSTCISQNGKYLKSIADILVIACDEIVMLWILC